MPRPSAWRSRCRTTSSTWKATPPRWASTRAPTSRATSPPIRPCWAWTRQRPTRWNCAIWPCTRCNLSAQAPTHCASWPASSSNAAAEHARVARILASRRPLAPRSFLSSGPSGKLRLFFQIKTIRTMLKTFHEIPQLRPQTPILDRAATPAQLRRLGEAELEELANELRQDLLFSVGQTGGHFGAGLGVIELTIALHYVFDTPDDRLVWDVGHQAYPHKILTGRREGMASLRQKDGLAAFPRRCESEYDTFGVGHSSTSIGAALGMAIAARLQGQQRKSIAVIGDGALTAGMAFEALNHAPEVGADM